MSNAPETPNFERARERTQLSRGFKQEPSVDVNENRPSKREDVLEGSQLPHYQPFVTFSLQEGA